VTIETFLHTYGYLAVLAGTALEGEVVLLLAAVAVHQGLLGLPGVLIAGCSGALMGDFAVFAAGRIWGERLFAWRPAWRRGSEKAAALMGRRHVLLVPTVRFLYGVRVPALILFGMSGIGYRRFLLLDGVATAVWAGVMALAGIAFGAAATALWQQAAHIPLLVVAALFLLLAAASLWRRRTATAEP